MRAKITLLILLSFVIVPIGVYIYLRSNDNGQNTIVQNEEAQIILSNEEGADSVKIESVGDRNTVHNLTNNYSVTIPENWRVSSNRNFLKYQAKNKSGQINCIFVTNSFEANSLTARDAAKMDAEEMKRSGEAKEVIIKEMKVKGAAATRLLAYEKSELTYEAVYLDNNKILTVATSYGFIHGMEKPSSYASCNPQFEDLVASIEMEG